MAVLLLQPVVATALGRCGVIAVLAIGATAAEGAGEGAGYGLVSAADTAGSLAAGSLSRRYCTPSTSGAAPSGSWTALPTLVVLLLWALLCDTYERAKSTTRVGFRVTCGAGIRPLARGVAARSGARGARTGRRQAATRQETVCAMDRCSQRVKIESPESVDREEGRRCDLERRDTPRYIRWKLVTQVSVRRILAPVTRAHAHAHPSQGSQSTKAWSIRRIQTCGTYRRTPRGSACAWSRACRSWPDRPQTRPSAAARAAGWLRP